MNKKLRLLVTAKCHNKCPMCCNNQFDFEKIPVVDRLDYDEISITGGEPLLPDCNGKTMWLAHGIRNVFRTLGIPAPRLFLYTAWVDYRTLRNRSYDFDGICLTLHSKLDVVKFVEMNDVMLRHKKYRWNDNGFNPDCSLRLNLFADMKALLPKDNDLSMWKVKDMEWVKDCPVPEGEDFRRIKELF